MKEEILFRFSKTHGLSKRKYNIEGEVMMCVMAQVLLLAMLFVEFSTDMLEDLLTFPSSLTIVVARFVCAIILHLSLQNEMRQGMEFMKFALNH